MCKEWASGTLSWGEAPRKCISKDYNESINPAQPGDMGQGTMTGSNTPWAQGPANYSCGNGKAVRIIACGKDR